MQPPISTAQHAVGSRYSLIDPVGQGGMGIVYRAQDRLTNNIVALKLVSVASEKLHFTSRTNLKDTDEFRYALASEFRTLASLHHPHIISVLDYGFDALGKPFYTMELL